MILGYIIWRRIKWNVRPEDLWHKYIYTNELIYEVCQTQLFPTTDEQILWQFWSDNSHAS